MPKILSFNVNKLKKSPLWGPPAIANKPADRSWIEGWNNRLSLVRSKNLFKEKKTFSIYSFCSFKKIFYYQWFPKIKIKTKF
jgi:hypothetical protein